MSVLSQETQVSLKYKPGIIPGIATGMAGIQCHYFLSEREREGTTHRRGEIPSCIGSGSEQLPTLNIDVSFHML